MAETLLLRLPRAADEAASWLIVDAAARRSVRRRAAR